MIKQTRITVPVTALALLLAGASAPRALASGFQLREQSASAQGTAFAGVAAGGADISTMFFNPATMTGFDGTQLVFGGTSVRPKAELTGASASRSTLSGGSTIMPAGAPGNAAKGAVLPELYAMWSLSKDFKLGFSLNAPFGLTTEYDNAFVGRYHALKSQLKTVDLGLNVAYRINAEWSLGATLLSRHASAELSNSVDYGQLAFLKMAQMAANPLYKPADRADFGAAATAFAPTSSSSPYDGQATVKGSKNVMGYKVGLTYQPTSTLHAGLAYQSATKVTIDGNVHYDAPNISSLPDSVQRRMNDVISGAGLVDGSTSAAVNLPDTTSLGLSWDVSPTVNLAFEADRTGWAKFKELRFTFGSNQSDNVTAENWRNTLFYSLGATWKYSQALTLRAGLASDQGAVDSTYRTPRIPDNDRTWISLGLGYAFSKSFGVDLAYTHIAVKDGSVALQAGSNPAGNDFFRGNLSGTFKNSIDTMAIQAHITF